MREALAAQLARRSLIDAVFQAHDAVSALAVYRKRRPQTIVLNVDLPDEEAFAAVRRIRRLDPGSGLVFLAGRDCDYQIDRALRLGVNGYVLMYDGIDVLLRGIKAAAAGGRFFSGPVRERIRCVFGCFRLLEPRSPVIAALSVRDRDLLARLARGASVKEAAATLRISYKTADNQKATLMKRLDIHDRVELARFAIREGFVSAT